MKAKIIGVPLEKGDEDQVGLDPASTAELEEGFLDAFC